MQSHISKSYGVVFEDGFVDHELQDSFADKDEPRMPFPVGTIKLGHSSFGDQIKTKEAAKMDPPTPAILPIATR
jgi:hypothetical protein